MQQYFSNNIAKLYNIRVCEILPEIIVYEMIIMLLTHFDKSIYVFVFEVAKHNSHETTESLNLPRNLCRSIANQVKIPITGHTVIL